MTVASVDLSGFTRLTERLSALGRLGAEAMTLEIDRVFGPMIDEAHRLGGNVVSFGGDALLVAFDGDRHEARAVTAVHAMRRSLARSSAVEVPGGKVKLRMSIGVCTGEFATVVTSGRTRQYVLVGPSATRVCELESRADAGQILVSAATARGAGEDRFRWLDPDCAILVRAPPRLASIQFDDDCTHVADAFVPPYLTAALADRRVEPDHRHVAVSFIHLPGLDQRFQDHGVDDVARHVDEVARSIERHCDQYGVTLTATDIARDGVKFVLMAGYPQRTVEDAARLAWCLRSIEDEQPGLLRIGAHWGAVYAGQVGTDSRRTASVMGDSVNVAARLSGKAAPGRIVMSDAFASRIAGEFRSVHIADEQLKGKRIVIPTFALGSPASERVAELDPVALGRAGELAELVEINRQAMLGQGRIVVVEGGAGMGVSQLVSAIRATVVDDGLVESGRDLSTAMSDERRLRGLFRSLLHVDGGRGLSNLAASSLGDEPQIEDRLGLVQRFLGDDGSDVGGTAVEHRADATADVLAILSAAARPGPTVLVIDDVHTLGATSTLLLERLCSRVADRPWMMLLTSEAHLEMVDRLGAHVIALEPLNATEMSEVVLAAVGEVALADDVLDQIVARAGGNPLFGLLLGREHTSSDAMPESLEALFGQRVDAVTPEQRRALRAASIVGQSAERHLIKAVTGGIDIPDDVWLDCGRVVAIDDDRIVFHHSLLRDAVYQGMSFAQRVGLHARLADQLVRDGAADPGSTGQHAYLGRLWSDAMRWCDQAGQAAETIGALAEAHTQYQRAVDASRRLGSTPLHAHSELVESLARTAELLGRGREAISGYIEAARTVPNDEGRSIALYCRAARRAATMDDRRRASRLLGQASRHLGGGAAGSRERRIVELERVFLLLQNARYDMARRRLIDLIPDAEHDGDIASAGLGWAQLEWALSAVGDAASSDAGRQGLLLLEQIGDDAERAFLLLNMSSTALSRGDWVDAIDLTVRAEAALVRLGDARGAAGAALNRAGVLAEQGRLAEARTVCERARRICRASSFPLGDLVARSTLARIRGWDGDAVAAADELTEIAVAFDSLHVPEQALLTRIYRAEVLCFAGEFSLAQDTLDGLELAIRACGPMDVAPLTYGRCRAVLHWLEGRVEAARHHADEIIEQARLRGAIVEVAMTLDVVGQMIEHGGQLIDEPIRAERDHLMAQLGIERFLPLPHVKVSIPVTS